jgi:hypothetical protein
MSNEVKTTSQEVEMSQEELDDILSFSPTASDIGSQVSDDDEFKPKENGPNIFAKPEEKKDNFYPQPGKEREDEELMRELDEEKKAEAAVKREEAKSDISEEEAGKILDDLATGNDEADETPVSKGGRPSAPIAALKKMADDGKIGLFNEEDDVSNYTQAQIEQLLALNIEEAGSEAAEKQLEKFYNGLPDQLKYAFDYVKEGGTDLKGLFQQLGTVEMTRDLSLDNKNHHAEIVRQFLTEKDFGSAEDIEAEIESYEDMGVLAKKAEAYKPKLDSIKEGKVQEAVRRQAELKQKQDEFRDTFLQNINTALSEKELNGIPLKKKTKDMLWSHLTDVSHPSMTGKTTNKLGYLLEQHQYSENPRMDLILEAVWLLSEPDAYREAVRDLGKAAATEETVKLVKKARDTKKASGSTVDEGPVNASKRRTVGKRDNKGFNFSW